MLSRVRCSRVRAAAMLACLAWASVSGWAGVTRVEVETRVVVADGRSFGAAGAYERLDGVIHFAFDPESFANVRIVDLGLAPRDEDGLVVARANFVVLQPVDPARRRGTALLEVSNRGGKAGLGIFNHAPFSRDPVDPEHFGDGLLLRLGLTIIWVGWQWDVPERPHQLRLHVPIATRSGATITGLVRADWVIHPGESPQTTLDLGHRDHVAYGVSDPGDPRNVLTVRDGRAGARRVVPRDRWSFARVDADGRVVPDPARIHMPSGFEPGRIYELVYVSGEPRVVGLGLAAIRDTISHARHDPESPFPVERGIAWGVSQTGRFLRMFLYQGFNTDEAGRQAFDALLIHTAGAGRGSFNHRFAQPSRDAHRFSAFFYPTDLFPFTTREQTDGLGGRTDGLASFAFEPAHRPKVFMTNTGYEYWGRAGALIHTSADGLRDVDPLEGERIYHLASAQHFTGRRAGAPLPASGAYVGNTLDVRPTMRALLVRLLEWVEDGREPPASRYPRLDRGELTPVAGLAFPPLPGVERPRAAHRAYRADYGPRWRTEGIIDRQPPALGPAFPALVPQVDGLGNEVGGIRAVELAAPVATYTPWSLRVGLAGPQDELRDFVGMEIPLARSEAEREAVGDPRPSLEALYGSRRAYGARAASAAARLVEAGLLLPEDVERVVGSALRRFDEVWGPGG